LRRLSGDRSTGALQRFLRTGAQLRMCALRRRINLNEVWVRARLNRK
jgi:hypothetical protein